MSEESKPAKPKGIKASDLLEIATNAYVEAVEAESDKPNGNLEHAIAKAKQAAATYVNEHHDGKGAALAQEVVAILARIAEDKNIDQALASTLLKEEVKQALRKAILEPEQQFTTRCETAFEAFEAAAPNRAKATEASKFESIAMEKLQEGVRDFVANKEDKINGAIMNGDDPKDTMFADAVNHAREYALKDQTKATLMAQAQQSGNRAQYFKSYIAAVNLLADDLVNTPQNAPSVKALKAIFDTPQQSAEVASPSSGAQPFLADDSPVPFSLADFANAPSSGPPINTRRDSAASRKNKKGWGKTIAAAALGIASTAGGVAIYNSVTSNDTTNQQAANVRRGEDDKEAEKPAPRANGGNNNRNANAGGNPAVPFVPDEEPGARANPAGAAPVAANPARPAGEMPAPAAPMPAAPAGEMPAPAAPMPGAPAAAPAAAAGEVADPSTLADADARKKYFEDYVASRVVDVSPKVIDRGFIEKIDDKFVVKKGYEVDFFKANEVGDWVWTIHNPSTHETLVMPSANSNLHIALVSDPGKNTFHLEMVNGRESTPLVTPEGENKSYAFPSVLPTHMLHNTSGQLFGGTLPGICLAASYKPNQVRAGTTHVLDNARSQRPELELRIPMNNKAIYLEGGVMLNLENSMALPLGGAVARTRPGRTRSERGYVVETPAYITGLQDCYIACDGANAGSIIKRPMGSIDTDMVSGAVGYNDLNKEFFMANPRAQGWQMQVPIATSTPTGDTSQKIAPNASNHIGMYVILDPRGTETSVIMQVGELRPATVFAGGPSAGLQASSVRRIIETSDQMLQPKGEPYTLNELALEVARWGRYPDQLADVLQKASFAFDDKLRTGSFGRDDPSISLGVGDACVRQLTNLTEPYDPADPASKTLLEKYRETCHNLVIEATKRAKETLQVAHASADPFERAELMGFYRPEDPVDATPDAEARKIREEQRKVDRVVNGLIEFGTKPAGRGTRETGDVLRKYMLDYWLPREGQLIHNPGQHDNGIHTDDGVPIKTSAINNGRDVRNIADANVGSEMQDYVAAVRESQPESHVERVASARGNGMDETMHQTIDGMVKRAIAEYKPFDPIEFAIEEQRRKAAGEQGPEGGKGGIV